MLTIYKILFTLFFSLCHLEFVSPKVSSQTIQKLFIVLHEMLRSFALSPSKRVVRLRLVFSLCSFVLRPCQSGMQWIQQATFSSRDIRIRASCFCMGVFVCVMYVSVCMRGVCVVFFSYVWMSLMPCQTWYKKLLLILERKIVKNFMCKWMLSSNFFPTIFDDSFVYKSLILLIFGGGSN